MKPETLLKVCHDTRSIQVILKEWIDTYNTFISEDLSKEELGYKLIDRVKLAADLLSSNHLEDSILLDGDFCLGNPEDAVLFQNYFSIKEVVAFQFDCAWMVDPGYYIEYNYEALVRLGFKQERLHNYYEAYQAYDATPSKAFMARAKKMRKLNDDLAMEYFHQGIKFYNQKKYDEAYIAFMQSADLHNIDASCRVGVMAATGIGCAKSVEEGYDYLKKASEAGNEDACNVIVELYDAGELDISGEEAWNYCMKAAKIGSVEASTRLKKGFDLRSKDLILKEKAQAGDSKSMFKLYQFYMKNNDEEQASHYLIEAGALDNVDALNELASISLKTNVEDAIFYYQKAAKQKSVVALLSLARIYRGKAPVAFFEAIPNDNTYIGDHKKEFDYYLKAADLGYVPAMTYVAKAYLKCYPISKDIDEAFAYAAKAANYGDYYAYYLIGYINEYDQEPDMAAAILFYAQAADKGVYNAMMRLYEIYHEGLNGIAKDEEKAKHYLFMSGGGRD